MTRALIVLLVGCVVGISATVHAQVTVSLIANATDVRVDDTFQIQISIESESLQNPDVTLPALDDFNVLQRQVSRPMSFSFSFGGRQQAVRSKTHYTFVVQPLREGRFTLRPVEARVGNQVFRSNPLTITVRGGTAPPASPGVPAVTPDPQAAGATPSSPIADAAEIDDVAFIRAVADKPEPYVGEQVTVTFYLYMRGNVQAQPSVDTQPTTDGFWIHDLLNPNSQQSGHRQVVKGLAYTAYTLRRFAAFPLREGELTIGAMAVSLDQSSVFDLFAGRAPGTLRRVGQPLVIRVRPLPDDPAACGPGCSGRPNTEVAVGRFTVQAKFDRDQAATGDAVTLTATVQGSGNIRTVALVAPVLDGLRILSPQVRDVVEAPGDLAGGMRTYEWLVVPERAGTFTLAPLSLAVFDPQTAQYGVATSGPLTLVAAGAAKPETRADPVTPETAVVADAESEKAQELAPIRTQSALARRQPRPIDALGYWLALAAMPALWLLLVLVSAVRSRIDARRSAPSVDRQLRDARKQLESVVGLSEPAAFYAGISQALNEAMQIRLDQPVGGYTRSALQSLLRERGMDVELTQRVMTVLSICEQGRFSPLSGSRAERDNTLSTARECFDAIARFAPQAGERP